MARLALAALRKPPPSRLLILLCYRTGQVSFRTSVWASIEEEDLPMSKAQNQSSQPYSTADLVFAVDPERGFLPSSDPLDRLPRDFDRWEEIAGDIPKLLAAETLHSILEQLPVLDVAALHGEAQLRRAMMLLSYFGHGYVWGGKKAVDHLPSGVAVPWHHGRRRQCRPPPAEMARCPLRPALGSGRHDRSAL